MLGYNPLNTQEMRLLICGEKLTETAEEYAKRIGVTFEEAEEVVQNYNEYVWDLTLEEKDEIVNGRGIVRAVKKIRERTGLFLEASVHVVKNSDQYQERLLKEKLEKEKNAPTYTIVNETKNSFRVHTSSGSFLIRVSQDNLDIEVGLCEKLIVEPQSVARVVVSKRANW